ncbi:hypothetical protein SCLCIDRAFT_865421 [Scleroderma citrinum Foug A]|uniref:Uncharacterized protein n=1 Tax=Scleroderma citrinum Foug A TaxID=1036808 RepID=A0A0C2ZJD5_9AGAM|nr:hypothetical protein SCLCIDRAFT_865421 [Scleroderma citrinum Foug A]
MILSYSHYSFMEFCSSIESRSSLAPLPLIEEDRHKKVLLPSFILEIHTDNKHGGSAPPMSQLNQWIKTQTVFYHAAAK